MSGTQGPEHSREEQAARARPEVMFLNRLETLERENRRLQRSANLAFIGIAVLLGLVVALVWVTGRHGMPGSVAQEVSARQFVLRDQQGMLRGAWGLGEDGAVRLVLQDHSGRPRVKVSVLDDGSSGLSFSDSTGHPRAVFALNPDQTGSVAFADQTGKPRGVLGISADGSANVVFADPNGSTRASLGVDGRGQSTFTLADRVNDAAPGPAVTESVGGEAADSAAVPPAAKGKPKRKP